MYSVVHGKLKEPGLEAVDKQSYLTNTRVTSHDLTRGRKRVRKGKEKSNT